MIDLFATDPNRYRVYDRAQNLLLTRTIGLAVVGFLYTALLWLFIGLAQNPNPKAINAIIFLASTFAFCIVLLSIGVWLTYRGRSLAAATLVTGSSLLVLVAFQSIWESFWGIDPLVLVLFGAYPIIIGSAAVLGNARLSLVMTVLTIGASLFICLLLPLRYAPNFTGPSAYGPLVFVIAEQLIIATLIRAAQSLFAKKIQELEEVRLAYEQVKQLDDLKDQFITNVNHELRTPVMALYNYVDVLRLTGDQMTTEKRQRLLNDATRVGDRLRELIARILDIRQIDSSASDFAPEVVSVQATWEAVVDLVATPQEKLSNRPLVVAIPAQLAIWGEAGRCQQILTNLLTNALKYSPAGTAIEIHAQPATRDITGKKKPASQLQMVEITIRDYGLGIPNADQSVIFQRFVRLPRDLASETIGSGVGLYLCRQLTEAMGGQLWVESSGVAGEGSLFHLTLPLPPSM